MAQRDAPVGTIVQTDSSTSEPEFGRSTSVNAGEALVAFVERKRPTSVPTRTTSGLFASMRRSRMLLAVTAPENGPTPEYVPFKEMGALHDAPPSVDRTSCPPWVSTKSPRPAQSVSFRESIAPIARSPSVSVIGIQPGVVAVKSYDFQIPPPDIAT